MQTVEQLYEQATKADAVIAEQRRAKRQAVVTLRQRGQSLAQIGGRLGLTRAGVQSVLRAPKPRQPDYRWWPTADEIAADIREELQTGSAPSAMRALMDGINYLPDAATNGGLAEALLEPNGTGDERWDTLLAAAIRYRLRTIGEKAPAWTVKQPLAELWWPFSPSLRRQERDYVGAPAELRRVGIFVAESGFAKA